MEAAIIVKRPWPSLLPLLGIAATVALAALASLVWTPHGAALFPPLAPPDATHWLGTDPVGRDVLSALMSASSGTLLLAFFGTVLSLFIAIPLGVLLAIRQGAAPSYPGDGFVLPAGLVIGLLVSALSAVGNLTIIVAIALPGSLMVALGTWRALAPLWAQDFVVSARIAGLAPLAAAQRHVLPHLLPRLGALAAELFALAILLEVSLSFAGLGTLPPGASLGLMLREAQQFGLVRPLLVIAPGAVALLLVLCLKLAAAGLRGGSHGRL